MPKYEVELPNGKTVQIEAANPKEAASKATAGLKAPAKGGNDVAKSFGSGVLKGFTDFVTSAPTGDPAGFLGRAIEQAGDNAKYFGGDADNPVRQFGRDLQAFSPRNTTKLVGAAYEPQTRAGRYAKTAGEFTPNAVIPGGPVRGALGQVAVRGASVLAPALASEGAGELAKAAGGGEGAQTTARVVGALAGGAASGVRITPRTPQARQDTALRKLNAQAPQDPAAVAARAAEYRAAGIEPTLTDVVDEAGRGVIRAGASRMTPARQAAQDFADARAQGLPTRMSGQAREHLSADPRTPAAIGRDLATNRRTQANAQYGAVRDDLIDMAPETVTAIRTDHGREAVREAARRERDPEMRRVLNGLADDALDAPATKIPVAVADRLSRVLYSRAQAAGRAGDNDLAATLLGLADDVRNPARQASAGYGQAVDGFAQESRLMAAADRGEDYLARDTDAFVEDVAGYGPEGLPLARATARRAVERASGENISAAPGVARRIATAPEVQARTRALLPEQEAQAFERAMALEVEAVDNARYVAPNTGSPTQGRGQDALQTAGETIGAIASAPASPITSAMTGAKLWLSRQGLSNAEAEQLVMMAIDPAQTARAQQALQARLGPQRAGAFLRVVAQSAPALIGSEMIQGQ